MKSTKYRPEIDGLRSVAIIPVVLFHAGLSWFPGGYVGVDVFFVISGYLITGILISDLSQSRFSIAQFYERRIRRIFPALFAVLAVSSVLAVFLLLPFELKAFGKSLAAATLFLSNFHFMGDTGYFAGAAETKPLLHIWSLAVEEQFYIFFPIYLYLMHRHLQRWLLPVTLILLAASFVCCVVLSQDEVDMAFYSSPLRSWELLAGAVLALRPKSAALPPAVAQALGLLGLLLIVLAVATFSETTVFPGYAAALPVVGTVLLIYATTANATWVGALLSTWPLRSIGLISYSLYLWHWPLLTFYRFWRVEHPAPWEIALVVVASVAMATLSLHFVERPFRIRAVLAGRRQIFAGGGLAMAAALAIAAPAIITDGLPGRLNPTEHQVLSASLDKDTVTMCEHVTVDNGDKIRVCSLGEANAQTPTFALWGDSHAEAMRPAFHAAAMQLGIRGLFFSYGGCTPLLGVNQIRQGYQQCDRRNAAILSYLAATPSIKTVYAASRWGIYAYGDRYGRQVGHTIFIRDAETEAVSAAENLRVFERGWNRTQKALSDLGRKVVVLRQFPESEFSVPTAMARARMLNRTVDMSSAAASQDAYQAFPNWLFAAAASRKEVHFVDLFAHICLDERCTVVQNEMPIYRDDNHMTASFAKSLVPQVAGLLANRYALLRSEP